MSDIKDPKDNQPLTAQNMHTNRGGCSCCPSGVHHDDDMDDED